MRREAPKQGAEGAPDVWLDVNPLVAAGLMGIAAGDELIVITWLHQGNAMSCRFIRDRIRTIRSPACSTRDHQTGPIRLAFIPSTVREIDGNRLRVGPMEAIDGTPVVDIKPVLC